jgi:hypothetical protein
MRTTIIGLCLLSLAAIGCGGADAAKSDVEKTVREAVIRLHKDLGSEDPKVRLAAFDRTMVDKDLAKRLFGKYADQAWSKIDSTLDTKKLRKSTAASKSDPDRWGAIKKVELRDIRKSEAHSNYKNVLTLLPEDVQIYEVTLTCENRKGKPVSYLLVDGKVRLLPRIDKVADHVVRTRSTRQAKDAIAKLSKDFLAALQSENLSDLAVCLVSVEDSIALRKRVAPGAPEIPADEKQRMKAGRAESIAGFNGWVMELLLELKNKGLAPKDLSYADSRADFAEGTTRESARVINMIFKHNDGREVHIRITNGMKLKDQWKFAGKPLSALVIKDGKKEGLKVD